MLKKFLPMAAGAALLSLASAAFAAQPLSDTQMDGVTAGQLTVPTALANAAALGIGEIAADTFTQTSTNVVSGTSNPLAWIAIGQSQAQAAAAGGILFQTAAAVHADSYATL